MTPRRPWLRFLARSLIGVMLANPLASVAAQLAVDTAAGGTTRIGAAGNGVPVVDIATPNGKGLSHNKFNEYNVDSRGLILNNATQKLQSTELGGYIHGNANLNGRAAAVILNEVTGSNRSELKGYTEVAGTSAKVIVANPHGITCDGCGFINTPSVTLTTGIPKIKDGQLKSYSVDKGEILIGGAGIDVSGLDAFDIITRAARLNGDIHAGRLSIVTGRNDVDAGTLEAVAKADDGSPKPYLAIDSSALGGMYAGAIKLIGTEDGVGFKLSGDMAASAADIEIDANGHLTVTRSASGRDLTVKAQSVQLDDNAYAAGNVSITATDAAAGFIQLAADKTLASGADLRLQSTHIQNQGKVLAGVDSQGNSNSTAALSLQGGQLQNAGEILSQGKLSADIKQLNNAGKIQSANGARIKAQSIVNTGSLVSTKTLQVESDSLENQGLLASGESMSLLGKQLSNPGGDIYSLGSLLIAGDSSLSAMDALENRSGSIESSGDMQLFVGEIHNRKEQFELNRKLVEGNIRVICYDCSGDHHNVDYRATETFQTQITQDSPAARIHSGGNLSITAHDVFNHYSSLSSSGNLRILANNLENIGAVSGTIQREQRFNTGRVTDGTDKRFRRDHINPYNAAAVPKELPQALYRWRLVSDIETQTATAVAAPAMIQSGGTLDIQAQNSLYNESKLLDNTQSTGNPLSVSINPPLSPDTRQQAVNPFNLPEGTGGLFQRSTGTRYVIETNPAFASLHGFLNSDYLLQKIGYRDDDNLRRLGDGLFEQRLIQQAIAARTGKRFLDGFTDDQAQFQYLMDNAIESQQRLNLSTGLALTAEQTAALTHDIVWLTKQEINGETVLAPVLYLAQAKDRLAPTGALLQGQDVQLISGSDLHNSGTIKATKNLQAVAKQIQNKGLMEAGGQLDLIATDSIQNTQGGIIKGKDVHLTAGNDISNERSIASQALSGQGFSQTTSVLSSAARIEAGNDLSLSAGRDIKNIGGAITVKGNAQLTAGNDLIIAAQEETQHSSRQDKRHSWNNSSTTQHSSEIQIGGSLSAQAGQDTTIQASHIKAGENIALQSGRDTVISAAANEQNSTYRYRSSHKKVTEEHNHSEQQSAQIEAGQNLSIESGSNLLINAGKLSAGNNAYLYAGDQIALLASQNSDYRLYEKNTKGSFGSKQSRRDEQADIHNIGSTIESGGNLVLKNEGNQLYQAARLQSQSDITLDSGAEITFEATKDLHQESHSKSKNNAFWQSQQGKGTTDETLKQTALLAQGKLLINAVDGLKIDLKDINQGSVSQTIDAMVKVDPNLLWLKQAEARGDIDWRQVKEIHDSFHYKHQGMGAATAIIVAIVIAIATQGAGAGLVSTLGSATVSAAADAAVTAVAINAASSTINHQGNLGAAFKETTSSRALKGYAASDITAGAIKGIGIKLPDNVTGASGSSLENWQLGQFAQGELLRNATAAVVNKALLNQNTDINNLLQATLASTFAAAGFKLVGDIGQTYGLQDGSASKVAMHALMGGLASEASGGDFKTGALTAGANELLVDHLAQHYQNLPTEEKNALLEMNSKIIGVLVATAQGNIEPDNLQTAAWVAQNGTKYNRFLHYDEQQWIEKNAKRFAEKEGITEDEAIKRLAQQALRQVDFIWRSRLADGDDNAAKDFLATSGQTFVNDLGKPQELFTVTGSQLTRMEMYADQAELAFYKKYVQSGVSRDLRQGAAKELKDIAVEHKDNVVKLYHLYKEHPDEVKQALYKAYEELDMLESLKDGTVEWFLDMGHGIAEKGAVAINKDLQDMLNNLHGADVSSAQKIIGVGGAISTLAEAFAVAKAVAMAEKFIKEAPKGIKNIANSLKNVPASFRNKENVLKISATGVDWNEAPVKRGRFLENFFAERGGLGNRLPENFKTFDFMDWDKGIATSVKSLDTLTESRINKPAEIFNALKSHIDAAAKFTQHELSKVELTTENIISRVVLVAIPDKTTREGWQQIDRAIDYANKSNVSMNIVIAK